MNPNRRKLKVHIGHLKATVYRWTHPASGKKAWRFAYRDGARWKYITRATQGETEQAAREKLAELQTGSLDWAALPRERQAFLAAVHAAVPVADQATILASLQSRRHSTDVTAAVATFLAHKIAAKGHQSAHLAQMRRDLEAFAGHFTGHTVADIQLEPLAEWWTARTGSAGRDRQQGIRRTLVSFFIWARIENMTGPAAATVAHRLPSLATSDGDLYVHSPLEMAVLLQLVTPEFLPWLLFGGFAGMRPEEIAPKATPPSRKTPNPPPAKPGLCWEHIDWQFSVIRLPKEVSKGGKRARQIPLHPVILAWFAHLGADASWTGRVCPRDAATAGETKRLGQLLDAQFKRSLGWPDDSMRHSYASYRNAVIRNLPQVSEEMGNSEHMLHKHYHNPKTREEGEAWFSLDPAACSDLFRFLQNGDGNFRANLHIFSPQIGKNPLKVAL